MRLLSLLTAGFSLVCSVTFAQPFLYDNFGTDLNRYLNETNAEAGDQITLAPAIPPTAESFTFEYWLNETAATGEERVQIRFYMNDGPDLAPDDPTPTPGTLFFDSGLLPLPEVGKSRITVPVGLALPTTFTWTAQFTGGNISQGEVAGLELYDPPVAGTSDYEFWEKTPQGWELFYWDEFPSNFGARIIPVPEPGSLALLLLGFGVLGVWRLRRRAE